MLPQLIIDALTENMALTEMSYTIVRMLQEFSDIKSEDSMPFKPSTNFVMSNVNGAKISLYRPKPELSPAPL